MAMSASADLNPERDSVQATRRTLVGRNRVRQRTSLSASKTTVSDRRSRPRVSISRHKLAERTPFFCSLVSDSGQARNPDRQVRAMNLRPQNADQRESPSCLIVDNGCE